MTYMTMMIDKLRFQENFKFFDNEIIVEVIDMFITEFPERMKEIRKNIDEKDMSSLRFNAHSIKGVIANFMADIPQSYAKQLEEKGKNEDPSELDELYTSLHDSTSEMIENLEELKLIYK